MKKKRRLAPFEMTVGCLVALGSWLRGGPEDVDLFFTVAKFWSQVATEALRWAMRVAAKRTV